ncbi:DNA breaking-rejoining enzyme [Trametes polyzona]|nr:DNA breaking-rejoining enzyme [Trametes polyzona]KAI0628704.1 DNA breaking-rejoining enzyme [Trametes polyzona]
MPRAPKDTARARASARARGVADDRGTGNRSQNLPSRTRDSRIKKPRKARPENTISASRFRPHVPAEDRLLSWTTPFAIEAQSKLSSLLPETAITKLFSTVLESVEPETRKNYGAGLLRFTQFCDHAKIPEEDRMPAGEPLLAAFVASWAGKVARTTIDNWVAGLALWHTSKGAPWNGDRVLKATCKAASKLEPAKSPKRPPVTLEHMLALRAGLDLTDAFDAAVYGLACTAFWGCRRLGELLLDSAKGFDPRKHVSRSVAISFRKIPDGGEFACLHIPWSKTTGAAGATITLTRLDRACDPVTALRHHLRANAAVPNRAPLFAFETATGGWSPMTRTWFLDRCNDVWAAAGLDRMQGHCFRIGGATELLLRGTHPDIVATQGGWKSRAFLEYWRKIESILPLFMSRTFDKSRVQMVERSMKGFKKKYSL